ncbi:MAG: hypothetical protein ACFCA4_18715 [Cyanophyceae cyanobacterium]
MKDVPTSKWQDLKAALAASPLGESRMEVVARLSPVELLNSCVQVCSGVDGVYPATLAQFLGGQLDPYRPQSGPAPQKVVVEQSPTWDQKSLSDLLLELSQNPGNDALLGVICDSRQYREAIEKAKDHGGAIAVESDGSLDAISTVEFIEGLTRQFQVYPPDGQFMGRPLVTLEAALGRKSPYALFNPSLGFAPSSFSYGNGLDFRVVDSDPSGSKYYDALVWAAFTAHPSAEGLDLFSVATQLLDMDFSDRRWEYMLSAFEVAKRQQTPLAFDGVRRLEPENLKQHAEPFFTTDVCRGMLAYATKYKQYWGSEDLWAEMLCSILPAGVSSLDQIERFVHPMWRELISAGKFLAEGSAATASQPKELRSEKTEYPSTREIERRLRQASSSRSKVVQVSAPIRGVYEEVRFVQCGGDIAIVVLDSVRFIQCSGSLTVYLAPGAQLKGEVQSSFVDEHRCSWKELWEMVETAKAQSSSSRQKNNVVQSHQGAGDNIAGNKSSFF